MDLYELQLKSLLEVKLMRVTKPKFSQMNLPLSGSYNSLNALSQLEQSENKLERKLCEFGITEDHSVSVDNMFLINNAFGKVLFGETLDILLIINSKADCPITVREIKIRLSNDPLEQYEICYKKVKSNLFISNEIFVIEPFKSYTQKLRFQVEIISKYSVETEVFYCCKLFDDEYAKHAVNKIIKTLSTEYYIEPNKNTVVSKAYKRFTFAANLPFKLKERLLHDSMERAMLEVNIMNVCPYVLSLTNIIVSGDKEGVEINKITEQIFPMVLEPDEEINYVYIIPSYEALLNLVLIPKNSQTSI